MLTTDLYAQVFGPGLPNDARIAYIVSGYASAPFAKHVLKHTQNLEINLIIGMIGKGGVPAPDHKGYLDLENEFGNRFNCLYNLDRPPIHSKCFAFYSEVAGVQGYIGSPNFSWGGFRDNRESLEVCNPQMIKDYFDSLSNLPQVVACTDLSVAPFITEVTRDRNTQILARAEHGVVTVATELESVQVSLLARDGTIHNRAGLNWGHRDNRDRNEAYIPVQSEIHNADPEFFPPLGNWFLVHTDDGETFWCVMAQANRKAIETPEDNSKLGLYFRQRMGLQPGVFVTRNDLLHYGRTTVTFNKIDSDLYFMDFSRQL